MALVRSDANPLTLQYTAPVWLVCRRVLSVHPGIYLSALFATWFVLLACTYVSREADIRCAAQRIRTEHTLSVADQIKSPWGQPSKRSSAKAAVKQIARQTESQLAVLPVQLPGWQQLTHAFQSAPVAPAPVPPIAAPKKPHTAKRSKWGMVPPPPPVGLVPPPPPTVPIPGSMLGAVPPYFGQNSYAVPPMPMGSGAAGATATYNPELFMSQISAAPSAGLAPAATSGAGDDAFKVIRHRQRKRTIAYR